jgi:4-amino-4-deoxy-L-arabinose transferase-like glycosyltransferase
MLKDYRVVLGLAVLVALFTALNVGLAMQNGALAMAPIYDDNTYLLDAYNRLMFDHVNSVLSAAASFYHDPPHSPFSTTIAMLGYFISGGADIGPYSMNFLVLSVYVAAVYLVVASRIGKKAGFLWTTALMFVPAAGTLITEFRPDAAAALFFAIVAYLFIFSRYDRDSKWKACALGVFCAFTVALKPSAVIIVFPMLGIAFVMGMAKERIKDSVLGALIALAAGSLTMIPLSIVWGGHVAAYLQQVFFTNSDVWVTPGTAYFHWTYNSFGAAGSLALGPFFYVGAGLIGADILTLKLSKSDKYPTLAYYMWVAIIYAGISLNPQKSVFQGNFFYFPFIIAMSIAAARLLQRITRPWRITAIFATIVATLSPPATTYQDARQRPGSIQALEQIATTIERSPSCTAPLTLASVGPYPIPPETIALSAAKQGIRLTIHPLFLVRDEDAFLSTALASTFVTFPNAAGKAEAEAQRLPGLNHLDRLMSVLDADPDWERVEIKGADPSVMYRNTGKCSSAQPKG